MVNLPSIYFELLAQQPRLSPQSPTHVIKYIQSCHAPGCPSIGSTPLSFE